MNVKESTNSQGEALSFEENYIHSMENLSFYDTKIKESIFVSLRWYCTVPIHDISISVKHGMVTLYGLVQSHYHSVVIAAIVKKTKGVIGLTNNICAANEFVPDSL